METLFTVILVVTSLIMIVSILLQSGQGSGLASGFGGASAGTKVFGGSGAGGFLLKMTVVLGAVFMITSMALSYMASQPKSVLSGIGSATTGQTKSTQAETIVTHGSGAASSDSNTPAESAPSIEFNALPESDEEPAAAPEEPAAVEGETETTE